MTFTLYRLLAFSFLLISSLYSFSANSKETSEKSVIHPTTGIELKTQGSLYWLEFDADTSSLWPVLKEFWSTEGIELESEQPALGYMQTRWINDASLSKKASSVLFSDSAPELRERFRLRVEPLPNNKGSRVFIHHTSYGILLDEEAVYTGYLPPSPQLEIEMLSRLALFTGADKNSIHQTVKRYQPTQFLASATKNNAYEIHIPGTARFVHDRLIQALDRMDIGTEITADGAIIATRTDTSRIDNPDAEKEKEEWGIDDSSDLEEEGFSFWGNSSDKNTATANAVYLLRLTENSSDTLIHISNHAKNEGYKIKRFSEAIARNLSR